MTGPVELATVYYRRQADDLGVRDFKIEYRKGWNESTGAWFLRSGNSDTVGITVDTLIHPDVIDAIKRFPRDKAEVQPKSAIRRVKRVRISGKTIQQICKTTPPRCLSCDGIPPDAQLLRLGYDSVSDIIYAFFEHESFPECPEGQIPEDITPMFTEYWGDRAKEALGL